MTSDSPRPQPAVPEIIAGPMLRRLTPRRVVLWLVADRVLAARLTCFSTADDDEPGIDLRVDGTHCETLRIGSRAVVHLIDAPLPSALPTDQPVGYDLLLRDPDAGDASWQRIADWAPDILYPAERRPTIAVRTRVETLLHGSCRKPHHPSGDGLASADRWLEQRRTVPEEWPALALFTGDQIYADEVAGPMLAAIHRVIERYGLRGEVLHGAAVADSDALYRSEYGYYHRDELLPRTRANRLLRERFFGGSRKPIFSTDTAQNHLITLAEVLAMYLLVWSPVPWRSISLEAPSLPAEDAHTYERELDSVRDFIATLPRVRRLLAHVPTYMIFDDHDVTDDWNLTAGWEQSAYGHPFSRRIIGNAMIAYLVCQAWGNEPTAFTGAPLEGLRAFLDAPSAETQDALIDTLHTFEGWQYVIPTEPQVVVPDCRTRRWRSERSLNKPSGLMDWEALTELQQHLMNQSAVLLVLPAPLFGVKLIEAVQRVFSWLGRPLLVDAENWMAHPGAANVILNVFRHSRTPKIFSILSGDVHYSFVYDVHLRGRRQSPDIWQITSSGIKNEFPPKLLAWFDLLNRWLYAPLSPLNWLTKRSDMHVQPRVPSQGSPGQRLVNRAGIGLVRLDGEGRPVCIAQITADGSTIEFHERRR